MKYSEIENAMKASIEAVEKEGFFVKGVVTDQGSNFEKCFKILGVKPDKQYFNFNNSKYYVFCDPPHSLKNARNLLLCKKGIRVATWPSQIGFVEPH